MNFLNGRVYDWCGVFKEEITKLGQGTTEVATAEISEFWWLLLFLSVCLWSLCCRLEDWMRVTWITLRQKSLRFLMYL